MPKAAPAAQTQSSYRFELASQYEYGNKLGFWLMLENTVPKGGELCRLEDLKLTLALGDGKTWRFATAQPGWQYGHDYTVTAELGPHGASLALDGKPIGESLSGALVPSAKPLDAGHMPRYATATAEYACRQTALHLTASDSAGEKTRSVAFPPVDATPIRVYLFEPQTAREITDWRPKPGQRVTLTATFRLEQIPSDLRTLGPLVDRYGQAAGSDWPGKIKSDDDLRRARAVEDERLAAWKARDAAHPVIDHWGGFIGSSWRETATGFYHVVRRPNGIWWLITPDGLPCFYVGLDTAPAIATEGTPVTGREGMFAELPPRTGPGSNQWWTQTAKGPLRVKPHTWTMSRLYGNTDWEHNGALARFRERLHAWGFAGQGKWCEEVPGEARRLQLHRGDVPLLIHQPDVFDPSVQARLRAQFEKEIAAHRDDHALLGWSYSNEHDEITLTADVQKIVTLPADVPAKRALIDYAVDKLYGGDVARALAAWNVPGVSTAPSRDTLYAARSPKPPAADIEAMRRYYEETWYHFLYTTIKTLDPNHIYFGFWIGMFWWENDEDWRIAARNCDVVGYDRYSLDFVDARMDKLVREAGKPILCGEMCFTPSYDAARGYGVYSTWTLSEAESGAGYKRWLADAARYPYCVGAFWFQYRDQYITGRDAISGPRPVYGEHFAFGLVNVTDQPKWDLIVPMREANLAAPEIRMGVQANSVP